VSDSRERAEDHGRDHDHDPPRPRPRSQPRPRPDPDHDHDREIETLGASDDEDGAYRLPIPAGRISFWTELPPPPEGGDDDERKRSGTRKGKSKAAKRKPATRGA
jgi:hypothetical protein